MNPMSKKSVVVGIYGISGCGKTFLLNEVKRETSKLNDSSNAVKDGEDQPGFMFRDGSQFITDAMPGGLHEFKKLNEQQKTVYRKRAIESVGKECRESGKAAVIAGHYMFWEEGEETGEVVAERRLADNETKMRARPSASVEHLRKWEHAEQTQLRQVCRDNGILFIALSSPFSPSRVSDMLVDFALHWEGWNHYRATNPMLEILAYSQIGKTPIRKLLVIDADKTLAPVDTGKLFWKSLSSSTVSFNGDCPLETLFGGPMGYSYQGFRQATLLYEEASDEQQYETICRLVASQVVLYPELISLLRLTTEHDHLGAMIVTCGLRRVWEIVLGKEGFADTVKVLGGGRITNGYVITQAVKGEMVTQLREMGHKYVIAIGDGPLDIDMLTKADEAIVVVGEVDGRSKSMDKVLKAAIDEGGLRAHQTLLPSNAPPRLDTLKLPLIKLTDQHFIDSLSKYDELRVIAQTEENTLNLLSTPTRNASVSGPALQAAHRRIGQYLAIHALTKEIGLEAYSIPHVQGHSIDGYRLSNERKTTIVALMRGGESMAFGINDTFPLAAFVHGNIPEDITSRHVSEKTTLILVDSVVNNGKTMMDFVKHVRCYLHSSIRIVMVANVVQAESVAIKGPLQALSVYGNISLVALRLSDNKFTGKGTTDTGNRLFNTTDLP